MLLGLIESFKKGHVKGSDVIVGAKVVEVTMVHDTIVVEAKEVDYMFDDIGYPPGIWLFGGRVVIACHGFVG